MNTEPMKRYTFQLTDEELILEAQMHCGFGVDPRIWNEAQRRGILQRLIAVIKKEGGAR